MKIKALGKQGLTASEMGLGCMGMSEFYGEKNDTESVSTIQRAYESGVTFFDTADIYGPFTNEILVGKPSRLSETRSHSLLNLVLYVILQIPKQEASMANLSM